jgi:hypothetical protein
MTGLSGQVSEGKSGSFFYFSHDGRFMLKTVNAEEKNSMCKMAHGYLAHLVALLLIHSPAQSAVQCSAV